MNTTEQFIEEHRNDDVRSLALMLAKRQDIDRDHALQQIAGWQKARTKLPAWAATKGIIFPPHISMEQCSSERTARYKAAIAARLIALLNGDGAPAAAPTSLVDLTGGFGVDFSYMQAPFERATYVEQQAALCTIARHNLEQLGAEHCSVVCATAENHLATMAPCTLAFLDPARRDTGGGRTFAIDDCTPNIKNLIGDLLKKAHFIVVKLSPMLDWRKAVADVQEVSNERCVGEVHIVSVGGECKELLLVVSSYFNGLSSLVCADDDSRCHFLPHDSIAAPLAADITTGHYLYEPNASVMKAGCFGQLAASYGVRAIAHNSHLFVSDVLVPDFPGRRFLISAISSGNAKAAKTMLRGLTKANVTVRNYPLSVADLRKRLRLTDGGSDYLFATTAADGRHLLLLCQKA